MDLSKIFDSLFESANYQDNSGAYENFSKPAPYTKPSLIPDYKPSGISAILEDFSEGAIKGDYSDNQSLSKISGQIGAGFIPIYGQISDARDTSAAIKKVWNGEDGGWRDLGLSLISWIPGFGDGVKGIIKASKGSDDIVGGAVLLNRERKILHEPGFEYDPYLPAGSGATDKYGNITISPEGTSIDRALAYHHESVHSFLSPRLDFLREFRADFAMSAYDKSKILKYLEEALAESYAQLRVNGLGSIPEGLSFPIKNGYVTLGEVVNEASNVAIGTITVGGVLYAVNAKLNEE